MQKEIFQIHPRDFSSISEFKRLGYTYTKIAQNSEYVCWEMTKEGVRLYSVEVWKKMFVKCPDGTTAMKQPNDEQFGRYGWYFVGNEEQVKQQILERFGICLR